MRATWRQLALLTVGVAIAAAGCSSDSSGGPETAITATDSECRVAATSLASGKNTFVVSNKGDKVTEVYVYGAGDKVISEKENIGPGTTATFSATLRAGDYEVACKPGQTGSGIRQKVTVGAPGPATTTAK